jgi:membrane protease YdiL (CAAX protease family)
LTSAPPSKRNLIAFYLLVLVLALPIWALSEFLGVIGSLKVPITDLMLAFTPLATALILVSRTEGAEGLISFLERVFDYRGLAHTKWLLAAVLLAPLIYSLTYVALHIAKHVGEPAVDLLGLPVLAAAMFCLAIGEEAGWTGYLLDPLQERFGALGASLILAIPWWLAHIPSIFAIGGTTADLAWWFPGAIALRVLMTSLYNSAGRSIPAVIIFHTMLNVGRSIAYPTIGSHYDPAYQAVGYVITFAISAVIVIVWGAKNLAKVTPMSSAS